MELAELASPTINSIMLGSLVVLMALGLTLTFAVTRVLNIAHAELITIGAYTLVLAVNGWGWHVVPALALAAAVSAIVAVLMDVLVFERLTKLKAHFLYTMVASVGIGIFLRQLIYVGADSRGWLSVKARVSVTPEMYIGYGTVTNLFTWVVPTAIVMSIALFIFLNKTRRGRSMRAVADNLDLAKATGIRTVITRRYAWLISGALAGLAGGLWAVYSPITPEMGWMFLLRVVAASTLGGLTSIGATIAGAYVVGMGENLGIFFAQEWFGAPLEYRSLITFVLIIIVLLIRPAGLSGIRLFKKRKEDQ